MIVIGADVHKSTHALAAVDANTRQLLGEKEIPAKEQGHLDALRWAHESDTEITRGRLDPATRAYLQRKEAEGNARIEAMRCLKRHLARHYHRLLLTPPSPGTRTDMPIDAAISVPCVL
jgi:hypothetical protein